MKISVIIPTYKREVFLRKCLKSLECQTRKADEVIVVLRKEDIESRKIARQFDAKIALVEKPGIIPAVECGLHHAQGDVVCYIDDDAIALKDWIERIEKHFQKPSIGAVCGPVIPLINSKPLLRFVKKAFRISWWGWITHNSQFITRKMQYVQCFRQCNAAFRRKLIKELDQNLLGDHCRLEVDAALKILNKRYKIICDPKIQVYHYIAPRKDDFKRIDDSSRIYSVNFNHGYVLYKNFSPLRRLAFFLFTFLIGDFENRGMLMFLKDLVLHPEKSTNFAIELRGRLDGIKLAKNLS